MGIRESLRGLFATRRKESNRIDKERLHEEKAHNKVVRLLTMVSVSAAILLVLVGVVQAWLLIRTPRPRIEVDEVTIDQRQAISDIESMRDLIPNVTGDNVTIDLRNVGDGVAVLQTAELSLVATYGLPDCEASTVSNPLERYEYELQLPDRSHRQSQVALDLELDAQDAAAVVLYLSAPRVWSDVAPLPGQTAFLGWSASAYVHIAELTIVEGRNAPTPVGTVAFVGERGFLFSPDYYLTIPKSPCRELAAQIIIQIGESVEHYSTDFLTLLTDAESYGQRSAGDLGW